MTNVPVPLSLLDLATVESDGSIGEALAHSVDLAQAAEAGGYRRVWYAEHHNMAAIASSATSVLIAHVAANTSSIRLGAGGVMLPNHSPLVIAEQYGTLAELHPGRIDLGLGRAPGSDMATFRALRREVAASEAFPSDIIELQKLLGDELPRTAVNAYPGRGTRVPLYVLGSSMFGASLAAQLGLPYAFASHFAPQLLTQAVAHYRANYVPSEQHPKPYVLAAVNVVAAPNDDEAEARFARAELERVRRFLSRGREREFTEEEAEVLYDTPAGEQIREMLKYTAIGSPERVREELAAFAKHADADELITVHQAPTPEGRLESVRLTAPVG
jgi:luciferase family oxidoreductase group 1